MHPNTEGILESSLYVIDVAHSVQFYKKIFGFQVISDFGERGCAMRAGSRQVLLLFKKGGSRDMVSPHDGDGELHLAFAIAADELTSWEAWLAENGIAVEETRTWEFGGHSLYFPGSRPAPPRDCYTGSLVNLLMLSRRSDGR
jgi:catechol-2,3-dioxygenase